MNSKYFSFVADYVPKSDSFPTDKHRVELEIRDTLGKSEVFRLLIEKAPLSRGELFSFRIKSGGLAGPLFPGWLFLTSEAVDRIEWSQVPDEGGNSVLYLPVGEEIP